MSFHLTGATARLRELCAWPSLTAAVFVIAAFCVLGAEPALAIAPATCSATSGPIGAYPYSPVTGDVIVCTVGGNGAFRNVAADNVSLTAKAGTGAISSASDPVIWLGKNATVRLEAGTSVLGTGIGDSLDAGTGLNLTILSGASMRVVAANSGSTVNVSGTVLQGAFNPAIQLSGDNNRVIINPSYTLGAAVYQGGTAGATNTVLELGGTGTASLDTSLIAPASPTGFHNFAKFEKTGDSTWTLTVAPGQLTPWTLTGGTLSIADDASLGDPTGSPLTFNGGTLNVTAAATSTRAITVNSTGGTITNTAPQIYHIQGVVSGAGNLTVGAGSFVSFEGVNTLTGTVTTTAGGAAFLTGAGSLATAGVVDNGSFDITGITPASATITSLSGSGNVFLGSKALTVTNGTGIYSGTMTGTGAITVTGGQLSVNGTSQSAITINSGGTLKGTGTVGGFTASGGGTVAPGNSIGTLNVAGPIVFGPGAIYAVEVDAAGNSDKVAATGNAAVFGGAAVNVTAAAGTYAPSTSYTIITAGGGVSGNFGTVTSNFAFLTPTVVNTGNSVVLTLVNNTAVTPATPTPVTFASVAATPNQIASATALQALGSGSLYNAVLVSSTANALAAFDASSGEIHATLLASQFEAANNARRTVLERMRRQTRDEGWSVWGSVGGDWGNLGANGNAASANRNGVDVSVGADGSLDDHWRGGIEGGYNGGNLNIAGRASHAHLTGGHVGAYAWGNYGDYVLRTGFSWGFGTAHTSRAISFAGFSDAATASENTKTVLLYGEAGYDIHLQDVMLEPYIGLAWTQLNAGSFRETGGAAALSGASKDMDNGYFSVGLNANTRAYSLGGSTTIAPLARIAWQHGFNSITASRSLAFIAGGPSFTVLGTPLDGDRALLDIGATLAVSSATEFSLGYYGALGGRANDHAVKLLGSIHL